MPLPISRTKPLALNPFEINAYDQSFSYTRTWNYAYDRYKSFRNNHANVPIATKGVRDGGSGCILYVTMYQTISCKNFKTKQDIMRSAREVMGGQSAYFAAQNQTEKKRSEETQTLRAGCSKAETKFSPHCRPPSRGARKGQNLISWRWSLHLPTNPVWWRSMHAFSSYRGNRPTHKLTHTDRTNYNTLHC